MHFVVNNTATPIYRKENILSITITNTYIQSSNPPGGSMKSKCTRSSIPSFNRVRTTVSMRDLRISGYVCFCSSSLKDLSVYSRKHLPGFVRPARPARCWAEAWDIGDTSSDSTLMRGLNTWWGDALYRDTRRAWSFSYDDDDDDDERDNISEEDNDDVNIVHTVADNILTCYTCF